jgi:acyl dehydratase
MTSTATSTTIPVAPVALAEGDQMPVGTVGPMTRTDFVRYAGASGDFHPLHHDDVYARNAGLPGVFGMGMLHAGVLGDHLARWVGPDSIRRFGIRFTGQVWPDDVLTLTGTVDRVEDTDEGRVAHLSLAVTRQTGDTAITATAVAAVAG